MKREISILGPIGSFRYKDSDIKGVQLVDVIANVSKLPEDTKELVVNIASPGGSVPVAKAIRGYLKSIQPRIAVTTKQVGDLASAGTILFGAGSKRIAAKGINPETGKPFQFMVHNAWITNTEGNAEALEKEAQGLRATDDELITMYQEDTGISKDAIAPLMKAESFFEAPQAIDLKFATESYDFIQNAAFSNASNMSKETGNKDEKKSLKDQILALLGIKSDAVATAPPAELMGKPVTVDGKPAVDGLYTVVGGVVTALAEAPAASPAKADSANGDSATTAMAEVLALLKTMPKQDEAIAAALAAQKVEFDKQIVELKKNIKQNHVPVGFTPENKAEDAKEFDRSFKANEHADMRKNDPEKYDRLFYAKYGRLPNK